MANYKVLKIFKDDKVYKSVLKTGEVVAFPDAHGKELVKNKLVVETTEKPSRQPILPPSLEDDAAGENDDSKEAEPSAKKGKQK